MLRILRSLNSFSRTKHFEDILRLQPAFVRYASSYDFGSDLQIPRWDQKEMAPIKKDLYQEHPNVAALSLEEVSKFRQQYSIEVKGGGEMDPPKPITKFEAELFPKQVMSVIEKRGYSQPTSIQAQTWPIVLQGQDLVGIAQTGTGKTLAYILPAILHINSQEPLQRSDGPIVLVVAPTRELVQQIHQVAQEFTRPLHLRTVCLYGGAGRAPQITQLEKGVHLCIATPGRLLDMLNSGVTNLQRCSYVVLDEADRMLDMGFEPQIRAVMGQVRPDRQTLMWSATWPQDIRRLAADFLRSDAVQVNIGSTDRLRANHNITQHVRVCDEADKRDLLLGLVSKHASDKMLIFTQTKRKVDWLAQMLRQNGHRADGIHGDRTQSQRDQIIYNFKNNRSKIMVATDVASRGLDVKGIDVVINFDFPGVAEDYIHRIGRTGRVEQSGTSYTFFTQENQGMASELVRILEEAGQDVPEELEQLAQSGGHGSHKHRSQRDFRSRNSYGSYDNKPHYRKSSPNFHQRKFRPRRDNVFGSLSEY